MFSVSSGLVLMNALTIDGTAITCQAGITILEAAHQAGIYIPTLCAHPGLPPGGICGLCAVEVEGSPELVQACETKVAPGMVVHTGKENRLRGRVCRLALARLERPWLSWGNLLAVKRCSR